MESLDIVSHRRPDKTRRGSRRVAWEGKFVAVSDNIERDDNEGVPYDYELAVTSVYEMSETLDKLTPFPWAA